MLQTEHTLSSGTIHSHQPMPLGIPATPGDQAATPGAHRTCTLRSAQASLLQRVRPARLQSVRCTCLHTMTSLSLGHLHVPPKWTRIHSTRPPLSIQHPAPPLSRAQPHTSTRRQFVSTGLCSMAPLPQSAPAVRSPAYRSPSPLAKIGQGHCRTFGPVIRCDMATLPHHPPRTPVGEWWGVGSL